MNRKACSGCGADLIGARLQGLCPGCLLKQGLEPPFRAPSFCRNCGDPLAEHAQFCSACGAAVDRQEFSTARRQLRTALEAKLRGQYRFTRLLGHGGMGEVYLARDLTLDREVAIKIIKTASNTSEAYERFRREAKTAARLSHPNIVPLHAFGEIDGMPYFVMGYVRGESLATRLRREGRLPEEEARRILSDISDALDHAHRQGVVHLDIKPDNVLLDDETGRALLADFGVARTQWNGEAIYSGDSVTGTPQYMSPEQCSGNAPLDGRSDIYALGVMGYAILAGRLPFEGSTARELLWQHLNEQPPRLHSLAPDISDSTIQAVERCLSKDPLQRWPDARSLKLALSTNEETQLPDALRDVQGQWVPGAVFVYCASLPFLFMTAKASTNDSDTVLALDIIAAGFVTLVYLLILARLKQKGFSFRQSQKAIWGEPAWWPFWYPRALRRPGNIWLRLPSVARRTRGWGTVVWFYAFAVFIPSIMPQLDLPSLTAWSVIMLATFGAIVTVWILFTAGGRFQLKRAGFTPEDVSRILISVPLSRASFWARPHIEALFTTEEKLNHTLDSPYQHLQTILRNANELKGQLRPLGARASAAARHLLASFEHAETETSITRNPETSASRVDVLRTLAQLMESLRACPSDRMEDLQSLSHRVNRTCDEIQALCEAKPTADRSF